MERVGHPVQKFSLRVADETEWLQELLTVRQIKPRI